MLARLNQVPGVIEAQVDASGLHFILRTAAGADLALEPVLDILGPGSRFERDSRSRNKLAEFDPREIWMDADNIRGLSHLEARILAADWGRRAAAAARLPAARASELEVLLRTELTREMDRIHARGGTSDRAWFRRAFRGAFERVIARMSPLSPAKARSLRQSLLGSLG